MDDQSAALVEPLSIALHAVARSRVTVGDTAVVGAEQCPCGRGLPLLASVQGKQSPLFHRLQEGS